MPSPFLQRLGIIGRKQAGRRGRGDRLDGRRRLERGVPSPVTELKQLSHPLDIGKPSPAEFDVHRRVHTAREPLRLHAHQPVAADGGVRDVPFGQVGGPGLARDPEEIERHLEVPRGIVGHQIP